MSEEIKFEDYKNMLCKLAWSFNRTTGLPFEDLLSSAYLAFSHSLKTYDPDKGRFSTYLYHTTRTRLVDHCNAAYYWKDNEKYHQPQAPDLLEAQLKLNPEHLNFQDPESATIFKDSLENLSAETQEICKMIFESPQEFLVLNAPKLSRGRVKDALREMGWTWAQIWKSFREIKTALSQMD